MGREARRVPLDFSWPLKETWDGFLLPERLRAPECASCGGTGYSPRANHLRDLWYGYVPFVPSDNGSTPFAPDSPPIRARAERNITHSPEFYGDAPSDVRRESRRLAALFNSEWMHHLNGDDVAALVEAGRLRIDDPTPERVNLWSIDGFGHDSINAHICIKARCEREGERYICSACGGHGSIEEYPGQHEDAESWEPVPPPTGDGWQMWETTSEGSPASPVFSTAEDLARYCAEHVSVFGSQMGDYATWLRIITGEDFAHVEVAPGVVMM